MRPITYLVGLGFGLLMATATVSLLAGQAPARLSPQDELGKRLFFDQALSSPAGQSCAACHDAKVGWTGPDESLNQASGVYEGAVKGRFANRKPPASAYAGDSPTLRMVEDGEFEGGMFWDGRATGEKLGDPLAEQAMGPFLNPLEQNMPDEKSVVVKVKSSPYAALFESVWGKGSLDAERDPSVAYARIGRSIAAYERSAEVNPFSSRFDDFWRAARAKDLRVERFNASRLREYAGLGLDEQELRGLALFVGKGRCANCHPLEPSTGDRPPLFTDFSYDNLGIPRNPANPFYAQPKEHNPDGSAWVDKGLGGYLETTAKYRRYAAANYGKHKVPTLRNVAKAPRPDFVKTFMHNGYFKSLEDVVRFYNTRDVAGAGWPPPEVQENLNRRELGNLRLTAEEETAIILFMTTLTDR
jgi:cytochrome c peroxidase